MTPGRRIRVRSKPHFYRLGNVWRCQLPERLRGKYARAYCTSVEAEWLAAMNAGRDSLPWSVGYEVGGNATR